MKVSANFFAVLGILFALLTFVGSYHYICLFSHGGQNMLFTAPSILCAGLAGVFFYRAFKAGLLAGYQGSENRFGAEYLLYL